MSSENAAAIYQPEQEPSGLGQTMTEEEMELDQEERAQERDIAPNKTRDVHIDVLKGVTMLLVIVSHMHSVDLLGYSIIGYMAIVIIPLFFFTSGYLFASTSDVQLSFGRFLWKKVLTLLLPYVVFFFLSMLWTETVYAYSFGMPLFGFPFAWPDAINALVFAGDYLYNFAIVPFPIWFLHALFIVEIFFYFIMKIKNLPVLVVIAFLLSAATLPIQSLMGDSPYWIVKLLPAALFFMLFGHLFWRFASQPISDETVGNPKRKQRTVLAGVFAGLALFLFSFFLYLYGGGSMWEITSYWYFIGAMVAVIASFLLSRATNNELLQYIGRRSLLYLGLHPFVLRFALIENLPDWFVEQGFDGLLAFIGYFLVSFLLITVLVALVDFVVLAPYRRLKRFVKKRRAGKAALKQAEAAEAAASADLPPADGGDGGDRPPDGLPEEGPDSAEEPSDSDEADPQKPSAAPAGA